MDDSRRTTVAFVASQLVFVAALIHLGLGLVEWYRYASVGFPIPPDYRWPIFVLSGVAIVAGLLAASRAERKRPFYLAGIVAMLGYVVGYFAWHLGGHRSLLLFGPSTAHEITLDFLVDHYFAGPMETVSLTVETVAAVLLAVLYLDADE